MTTPRLILEKVRAETLPKLTQVLQAAARALEQKGTPLWSLTGLEAEALLNDYPESEMFLGFEDDEAVAGMILLEDDPVFCPDVQKDESLFIHKLTVTPSAQGTGAGARMLSFALARARAQGKRYLRLDCGAERPKLRAFYERFGFRCVGERDIRAFPTAFYELDVSA